MHLSSLVLIVALTMLNLGLIWLLLAIPLGVRTVTRTMQTSAPRERVWSALYPFGANASWNGTILSSELESGTQKFGKIQISYEDRYGDPIERKVCLEQLTQGESYKLRIVDDTTLDPAFWQHYHEQAQIADAPAGCTVTVSETDRYRGFAFLGFRYFKIRRQLMALKIWAESGKYRDIGVFERPFTQVGMAFVSTMLLWPFFGLTPTGLILSSMLTLVVAMHEFGHMLAFRIMGHKSARMIFIPILGGIALGGRPYDRHFEVGFSALLGAPFQMVVTGSLEPKAGTPLLTSLPEFIRRLATFRHPSLRPFDPPRFAMIVKEKTLAGGCRTAKNLPPLAGSMGGEVVVSDAQTQGFPTGPDMAQVCEGSRRYAVIFRPLIPGER